MLVKERTQREQAVMAQAATAVQLRALRSDAEARATATEAPEATAMQSQLAKAELEAQRLRQERNAARTRLEDRMRRCDSCVRHRRLGSMGGEARAYLNSHYSKGSGRGEIERTQMYEFRC
jgi:hypothetical protein